MVFAPDPTFREGLAFNVQRDGRNLGGTATGAFHVGANAMAPLGTRGFLDLVTLAVVHNYAQVIGSQHPTDARRVPMAPPHRMHSSAQSGALHKARR